MAIRNLQDLVRVQKPMVERKGREVSVCFFYQSTGECFGHRCFWIQNGQCQFCNLNKKKE